MRKPTNSTPLAAIENAAQIVDRGANEPVLAGCVIQQPVLAGCVIQQPVLAGCENSPAHQHLMAGCADGILAPLANKR